MEMRIFPTWIGVLLFSVSIAQSAKEIPESVGSLWNFKPKQGNVEWTLMPAYGHLLVGSDSAIYSMDALSGAVNWHSKEFGRVTKSMVHAMDGDPLIRIDHAEWGPSIVSLADGTIPFKSKGSGIDKYQGSAVASDPCALFVWGSSRSGLRVMQRYCIGSKKPGWSLDLPASTIIGHELRGNSQLILHSESDIHSIDISTGELNWSRSFGTTGKISAKGELGRSPTILTDERLEVFYVLTPTNSPEADGSSPGKSAVSITGHSKYSGDPQWGRSIQIKAGVRSISLVDHALLVTDLEGMISFLDAYSGTLVWEKMADRGKGANVMGVRNGEGCLIVESFADGQMAYVVDATSGKLISGGTMFYQPIEKVEALPGGFLIHGTEYVLAKLLVRQDDERMDLWFKPHSVATSGTAGYGLQYKQGTLTKISMTSPEWGTRTVASKVDSMEIQAERVIMNGGDMIVQYPEMLVRINGAGRTLWELDLPKGSVSANDCSGSNRAGSTALRTLTKDGWESDIPFEDRVAASGTSTAKENNVTSDRSTGSRTSSKSGGLSVAPIEDQAATKGTSSSRTNSDILRQKMAVHSGVPLASDVLMIVDGMGSASVELSAIDLRSGSHSQSTSVSLAGGKSLENNCDHAIAYVIGPDEIICYGIRQ